MLEAEEVGSKAVQQEMVQEVVSRLTVLWEQPFPEEMSQTCPEVRVEFYAEAASESVLLLSLLGLEEMV
jgi:hypothetical protein